MALTGWLNGIITDSATGEGIAGATVWKGTSKWATALPPPQAGNYLCSPPAGTYTLTYKATGYVNQNKQVTIPEGCVKTVNVALVHT